MPSASEIRRTTLLRAPLRTLWVFGRVCIDACVRVCVHVLTHLVHTAAAVAVLALAVAFIQSPPTALEPLQRLVVERGLEIIYWVTLGVLSSIGLGSGLHTFVLFLGPHIARVAIAALSTGDTHFTARIDKYFSWDTGASAEQSWMNSLAHALTPTYAPDAFPTSLAAGAGSSVDAADSVSVLAIAALVAWPSFLWGAGTALGELPPYFIARAAAKSGEALEELEEVDELEHAAGKQSLVARAKVFVYEAIQRYGFVAVLLAASIPNPLFDLAGLTCGHFGIPFATFFGATFIGKAVVKVSIQVFFIIFSAKYGSVIFEWALTTLPRDSFLHAQAQKVHTWWMSSRFNACTKSADWVACCASTFATRAEDVSACLTACTAPAAAASESLVQQAWGFFILAMVLYFVISIVNATVQERLARDAEEAATPKSVQHAPHLHGGQVVSALLQRDGPLDAHAHPHVNNRSPGLGEVEPDLTPHRRILNKSDPHPRPASKTAASSAAPEANGKVRAVPVKATKHHVIVRAVSGGRPRGRSVVEERRRATPSRRGATSISRSPARDRARAAARDATGRLHTKATPGRR